MFNGKKIISGIAAVLIYFLLIYIVLLNYNRHEEKAKNYVEENSNRITVTLVNSDNTVINKSSKENNTKKPLPQSNLTPPNILPIVPLKTPIKVKPPTKIKEPIKRVIAPKPNIKLKDRAKKEKERSRQAQIKKDKAAKKQAKEAQVKKDKALAKKRARQAWIKKDKAAKKRVKEAQVKKDKALAKKRARQAWIKKDKAAKKRVKEAQVKKDKALAKERARQAWIKKDKAAKKQAKEAQVKKDKALAKKRARQAWIKKDKAAKKEKERLARIAKEKEATAIANQDRARASRVKKERAAKKERERLARITEEREATKRADRAREREQQARAKKEREQRQSQRSQDLFSSVNTQEPVRRVPVRTQSRVQHTSASDRIRESHQSGRTSTRNQNSGVKNAYIARVKRHLNNWSTQSNYAGHSATIKLTVRNNGKFRFVITRTSSGSLSAGLKEFLAQLNRMGLGRHDKSSAYVFTVHFKAN